MNPKIKISEGIFRILYLKYKGFLIPFVLIFVSGILIWKFILPQIEDYKAIQAQEKALREKIALLRKNIEYLQTVDDSALDQQIDIVKLALPLEKDYAGIITALAKGAAASGVILGDYGFAVGDLSTKSAQVVMRPTIGFSVGVDGDDAQKKQFFIKLSEQFPLAEFVSASLSKTNGSFALLFYYQPLAVGVDDITKPIVPIQADKLNLIETLIGFKASQDIPIANNLQATVSATLSPTPTQRPSVTPQSTPSASPSP